MSQTLTVKIKLLPTKEQAAVLHEMSQSYIATINALVTEMVAEKKSTTKSSKDVAVPLPSIVKNQAIRDAKSVFAKVRKSKFSIIPVLKKPVCVWNNQNYSFDFTHLSMPVMVNGKAKKMPIRALLIDKNNRNFDRLKHKLGTLRITQKAGKWIAQISVTIPTVQETGTKIMGVDLGLKVPAVVATDDDKMRFFGNGRQNKYMKRMFRAKRKAQSVGQKKETERRPQFGQQGTAVDDESRPQS